MARFDIIIICVFLVIRRQFVFLEVAAEVEELTVSLAISRSFVLSKDVLISFFNELEAFFFDFPFLLVLALFSAISIVVFDLISSRSKFNFSSKEHRDIIVVSPFQERTCRGIYLCY